MALEIEFFDAKGLGHNTDTIERYSLAPYISVCRDESGAIKNITLDGTFTPQELREWLKTLKFGDGDG